MTTPEDMAGMQDGVNTIELMMNSILDAAGKVRARAVTLGFGDEAADQIGSAAFSYVLGVAAAGIDGSPA